MPTFRTFKNFVYRQVNSFLLFVVCAWLPSFFLSFFEFIFCFSFISHPNNNNSHDWVLSNISKTLKELSVSFHGEFAASLSRLLMICKNLTKLKYYCWSTSKWFSVPTLPHTTMLKNIDLDVITVWCKVIGL